MYTSAPWGLGTYGVWGPWQTLGLNRELTDFCPLGVGTGLGPPQSSASGVERRRRGMQSGANKNGSRAK